MIGSDFFPAVDGGQLKLHVRAHTGTRVEETARLCDQIEALLKTKIPKDELDSILDNVGLPVSGINMSYSNSQPVGPSDADIMISFKPDHRSVFSYADEFRKELRNAFPGVQFAFLPADITTQVLNFGQPAPIDIKVSGPNLPGSAAYANKLIAAMRTIPGIVDLRMAQSFDNPQINLTVDRDRAQQLGIQQRDVANSLLVSLSGSFQTAPTFWLNQKNGVSYQLVSQTPQYQLSSLDALKNIPVTSDTVNQQQILGALAHIGRSVGPAVISHYNVAATVDVFAAVQHRDLGGAAADIDKILDDTKKDLPGATHVAVRGQIETMRGAFTGLYEGLAFAILLVYLLIVVNFQSWIDPFIIITALPAALAGIVWMLFVTHTTLSVPALTGAIMCMGVATANSILVVSFARERMDDGANAFDAALDAGFTRFRPVLMTALAMIMGMLPMAIGLGEGGEQNAPLGRAVIGGLSFATFATLFFVPTVFAIVHGWLASRQKPAGRGQKQAGRDRRDEQHCEERED